MCFASHSLTHDLSTISFFFYVYGAHRDLHSFPTRRSSDLVVQRLLELGEAVAQDDHHEVTPVVGASARRPLAVRSEEHTSELQSRVDLVCRLLLEKKKKKKSV